MSVLGHRCNSVVLHMLGMDVDVDSSTNFHSEVMLKFQIEELPMWQFFLRRGVQWSGVALGQPFSYLLDQK